MPALAPAVTAPEPPAAGVKLETEIDLPAEKEKDETPQLEPAPEPETVTNLQPGNKIYVEGFGWLEYQGPNHCEYGADIFENGNKIGIMG